MLTPGIQHNISLRPYNTFGMDAPAAALIRLEDQRQLPALTAHAAHRKILGGGSNILLTGPVEGLIIKNELRGISAEREDAEHVFIRAGAGELWHDLVLFAIRHGLGGIENLALIPGTVGASPIQNIGAYGVEVREAIEEVQGWSWAEKKIVILTNAECRFGYRDSIFKTVLRDKILVTSVLFKLNKQPVLRTDYGAITTELEAMKAAPSVASIAQAVMNIRRSKLPDPAVIGNAGSFFKNPTIPAAQYISLQEKFPTLPHYPAGAGMIKVPAGWLIEQCGWKGFRRGDAGVHKAQALVLVNYGSATGSEIWALSEEIVQSVNARYGIVLEREVQVW